MTDCPRAREHPQRESTAGAILVTTDPAIFVIADKAAGSVAVVNPKTFEVSDELFVMNTAPSVNAVAASSGVIWIANNSGGMVQRFDTAN